MMRRRDLLLGLSAVALTGCPRTPPAAGIVRVGPQTVRLGWRWIPGLSYTYESVVSHVTSRLTVVRGESWTYTALALDPSGVVTLVGTLVGFGANISEGGQAVEEARLRASREVARNATPSEVELRLRLTGRLLSCSADDFASALPHRALAMNLPSDPAFIGSSWDDPAFATSLAQLLPVELPVRIAARTTLAKFSEVDRGWQARLEHQAQINTLDGGPRVRLTGFSTWDATSGALDSRRLEVRLDGLDTDPHNPPGLLTIELQRRRKAEAQLAAL